MAVRVVTGVIKRPDNSAWRGGAVRFRLTPDTFRASPAETYPEESVVAVADASGNISVSLVSGADVVYEVTLPGPNGDQFFVAVPDGSATTLEALRASYAGAPASVASVEAALIAFYGSPPTGRPAVIVQEGDATRVAELTHLDFDAAAFDVTESPTGEANVSLAGALATTGTMKIWPFTAPESGWLICDGSTVLRSTALGTLLVNDGLRFGVGNGTTTVNIPDLRDRFPIGLGTDAANNAIGETGGARDVTLTAAQMPSHNHWVPIATLDAQPFGSGDTASASEYAEIGSNPTEGGETAPNTSSAGSGNSHTNMPPFVTVNYVIKT